MNKNKILNILPEPDDFLISRRLSTLNKSKIWFYGNFEFHFNNENKLYCIFNDYINSIDGGNYLEIKPWIFNKKKN